ncbi:flagellar protein FlaG [Colwellia sp. E2M01]|uniref:flagellar protein FlaG n=1 Tax=Colwellia sp. E2M01 TaxID=2841561 RepID=UPI001C08000D|nr:flagellar protein FlaG [Colwellia sp. E2M01]MBU2869977.1 flagellar protein FlaG [Colwellia sp. E2M01]
MSINSMPINTDNSFIQKTSANIEKNTEEEVQLLLQKQSIGVTSEITEESTEAAKSAEESKLTVEEVDKALEVVASFLQNTSKQVDFSSDNNAGKIVITVTDKDTQEVINQFPSEKIISMAEKIQSLHQEVESISGLLVDSHV